MVKRYREGGREAFFANRRPRGARVLTEAMVEPLQDLLDAGLAYGEAAKQVGVKSETVRKGIQRACYAQERSAEHLNGQERTQRGGLAGCR